MMSAGMSSSEVRGSCVVLVCISNKAGKVLTHDKFYKMFSPFGTIQRILIFERGAVWKTFVEFDSVENAYQARVNLNGVSFGDDSLKMNVYASQLGRIQFQGNNSGGVDYATMRAKMATQPSATSTPMVPQSSFLKFGKSAAQTPNSAIQQWSPFSNYASTPFPANFTSQQMLLNQQKQLSMQFMQQQLFLSQQMQSLVQRLNQLMFMVQQINSEQQLQQQFYYTQMIDQTTMYQQADQQQQLLKEMTEVQKQLLSLTDQYGLVLKNFVSAKQPSQTFSTFQNARPPSPPKNYKAEKPNFQVGADAPLQRRMSDSQIPIQFVTTVQDADTAISPLPPPPVVKSKAVQKQVLTNQPLAPVGHTQPQALNIEQIEELLKRSMVMQRTVTQEDEEEEEEIQKSPYPHENQGNEEESQVPLASTWIPNGQVKISKVIYARWFDKKLVGLRMLYNVFSTFGNIDKMIYLKERSSALVQFETTEFATQAKDALTGLRFFGQTIQVFYANREEVTLKSCILGKGEFKEDPATLEDSFEGCLETNRFQPDLSHTFASPSDSLLLSNLSKQSCSEEIILSVFQPQASPNDQYEAIIKYNSVEQSLAVLSQLHGIEINGRIVHIQFATQKI